MKKMKGISLYLEIARWVVVLAAVILLVFMFGGNTVSDADPDAVCAAVTETLDLSTMKEGDNQLIKRLYGLDPSAYEACVLYAPTTNMGAEELLIVKLTDTSQQETVRAAIEARLETQKNTFEGYGVEQFELLTNKSVIEIRGNYVLFVVNTACDEAKTAFVKAL